MSPKRTLKPPYSPMSRGRPKNPCLS
jgi:hypothetical protein